MITRADNESRRFHAYGPHNLQRIPQLRRLSPEDKLALTAVAQVMPFRVNEYVLEELIHWPDVPEDPLYQMTFPQPEMLEPADFQRLFRLLREEAPEDRIRRVARRIQQRMNPHPAGQIELNVPVLNGRPLPGIQHKYRETVLVFPRQGQTCHAYCTYCFRWAQFVGIDELKFATREADRLARYLQRSDEVSDVLITGGDPLVMKTSVLRRYIEPLLAPELSHVTSIRIGTKAISFWPFRFLANSDADDLLRLFEQVRQAGKQLALMAHLSHPRELEPPLARKALKRVQDAGAVVRCQSPLIRHVNDDPRLCAELWRQELKLGAVPYYMFVARDTGARHYFEVPLAEAHEIYRRACNRVSGLARTVRGPSMSATPGKVLIQGTAQIGGEKVFVLSFIQARDPSWVGRPFFARFDPQAAWLDELQPAGGAKEFFFDPLLRKYKRSKRLPAWNQDRQPRSGRVLFGHVEWE